MAMKNVRVTLIFLLVSAVFFSSQVNANSTTTRAGFLYLSAVGPNVYELHAELILTTAPVAGDMAEVEFGDATQQLVGLDSCTVVPYPGGYYRVVINGSHTFSTGSYTVAVKCGKRVPWIQNISSSDTTTFELQSPLVVDPNIGANSQPFYDAIDLLPAMNIGVTDTFAVLSIDPDGDSISGSRTLPVIPGSTYPETVGGGTFSYDDIQMISTWNPQVGGLYTVTYLIEEWKLLPNSNRVLIGITMREVLIDAGQATVINAPCTSSTAVVFPNPASQNCTFTFPNNNVRTITICDQSGREIWCKESTSIEVEFPAWKYSDGVYFFHVFDGSSNSYGKLIIRH